MKINIKTLLIVVGALAVLLVVTKLYKAPKSEKTLKTDILELDSAKIAGIYIYPKGSLTDPLKISWSGGDYKVSKNDKAYDADKKAVQQLLNEILAIKSQGLASKNKAKWRDFDVTDSLGIRVKVLKNDDEVLQEFIVGKFTYEQGNSSNPYGGISGTSYVRLADEDEIYTVKGFLVFSFNRDINSFRNKLLIEAVSANINKITLTYPLDSGFVLTKNNNAWTLNMTKTDSVAVQSYLSMLSTKSAEEFYDEPLTSLPTHTLKIEGAGMAAIEITAYPLPDGNYAIKSTLNPKAVFKTLPSGLFADLFKSKNYFVK
ncbi:MAG: DUF4340 domain-containing protein [Cytophagales bacterium]|nr:DUF4340 domain-containing protein [Cytophagales bacterium]